MYKKMHLLRSASSQEIADAPGELIRKLCAPQNRELRRALAVWVRRLVLRRCVPEGEIMEFKDPAHDNLCISLLS